MVSSSPASLRSLAKGLAVLAACTLTCASPMPRGGRGSGGGSAAGLSTLNDRSPEGGSADGSSQGPDPEKKQEHKDMLINQEVLFVAYMHQHPHEHHHHKNGGGGGGGHGGSGNGGGGDDDKPHQSQARDTTNTGTSDSSTSDASSAGPSDKMLHHAAFMTLKWSHISKQGHPHGGPHKGGEGQDKGGDSQSDDDGQNKKRDDSNHGQGGGQGGGHGGRREHMKQLVDELVQGYKSLIGNQWPTQEQISSAEQKGHMQLNKVGDFVAAVRADHHQHKQQHQQNGGGSGNGHGHGQGSDDQDQGKGSDGPSN